MDERTLNSNLESRSRKGVRVRVPVLAPYAATTYVIAATVSFMRCARRTTVRRAVESNRCVFLDSNGTEMHAVRASKRQRLSRRCIRFSVRAAALSLRGDVVSLTIA